MRALGILVVSCLLLISFAQTSFAQIATPTPPPTECLPTRLSVGLLARVLPGLPNRLRATPSLSADVTGSLNPGTIIDDVLEGPVCVNGVTFWRVRGGSQTGWTAESDTTTYYLEPLFPPTPTPTQLLTPTPEVFVNTATGCAIITNSPINSNTINYVRYEFATEGSSVLREAPPLRGVFSSDGELRAFFAPVDVNVTANMRNSFFAVQNLTTGEFIRVREGLLRLQYEFVQIVWSSDSQRVATGLRTSDEVMNVVLIADRNGELVAEIPLSVDYRFESMAWSPNNQYLAINLRTTDADQDLLALFDANGTPITEVGVMGTVDRLSWTPDSTNLVLLDFAREPLVTYNLANASLTSDIPDDYEALNDPEPFSFNSVLAQQGEIIYRQQRDEIWIETVDGTQIIPLPDQAASQSRFALVDPSPDGEHFIVRPQSYRIFIYSLSNLTEPIPVARTTGAIAWSADGSRFLVASADGMRVYNLDGGQVDRIDDMPEGDKWVESAPCE